MHTILAIISLGVVLSVTPKYFRHNYNHIENMWFGLAFLIFFYRSVMIILHHFYPDSVSIYFLALPILELYAYWIILIMVFRLRQVKSKWSYQLNKYVRATILLFTVISLYYYHTIEMYQFNGATEEYIVFFQLGLSFFSFIIVPYIGYYLFFKIGYGMLFLSHIVELNGLCKSETCTHLLNISHIIYLIGSISLAIAICFVYCSDSIIEKRRNPGRRIEDRTSS